MKILSLDPGAARMGWAVLDDGKYIHSGIFGVDREVLEYQPYRLKVIQEFSRWFHHLANFHLPDVVVAETLPVKGFNNMSQSILAQAAVTSCMSVAYQKLIFVDQISASRVKKAIGGSGKATKVGVRNGVLQLLPELAPKKSQWTKVFDESDAIAVGLTYQALNKAT